MAKRVGSATATGSVAGSGSGAVSSEMAGSGAGGQQVAPFVSQVPGTPVYFPSFHGRRVSWVAVSMIMFAFLTGGFALIFLVWWLFWASIGLVVLGLLLATATSIFDDWY